MADTEKLRHEIATGQTRTVIFERAEGVFYPLVLPISDNLAAHAECNPGTVRISDAITNETLWRLQ
jgi:hypothetical protein